MIDISKYTSKSEIKEILQYVKVEGNKAMATDSFRLAVITLPEPYNEIIQDGFYKADKWKAITKEMNAKVPSLLRVQQLVDEAMIHQPDETYPDVSRVIPNDEELTPFDATQKGINIKYFYEFLSDVAQMVGEKNNLYWKYIQQQNNHVVYKDLTTTIILMSLI